MHLRSIAVAAVLTFGVAAHADSYRLFNLSGTFTDGSQVAGTVNLDLDSNGMTDTSAFESIGDFAFIRPNGTTIQVTGKNRGIGRSGPFSILEFYPTGFEINLYFPTATPGAYAGYLGGPLSTSSVIYITSGLTLVGSTTLVSGALTPVTTNGTASEPSSLALLGTGALGLIGAARRRFAA